MMFLKQLINKTTSKRGKWMTLIIWILITGILSFSLPSVNEVEDNSAEQLPGNSMSVKAAAIAKKQFPSDTGVPLLLAWYRDGGLTDQDYAVIQNLYKDLNNDPVKAQDTLPPLGELPVQALKSSASQDEESIITPVFINKNAGTEVLQNDVKAVKSKISKLTDSSVFKGDLKSSGLHVRLTGPVGIQTDAVSLFSKADVTLLISTTVLVLVLLILLYRSPILAVVPLIGVGFAYGVISPLLGLLAKLGWIVVDSQAISIMTVLLFGAGTDYCLFLVSKYRENLLEESDKYKALQAAIRHSGGAILMSALTVVLGLVTLLLAHFGSYHRFAIPFSLAVLIMGIAALTLLPAILAILGRASFFPFIPRTKEMTERRAIKKNKPVKQRQAHGPLSRYLGQFVTRRPWAVIIATVIILGGLATFTTKIQYTYDLLESFPKDMPSREGFSIISEHFPPGKLAPVQVIVNSEGKNIQVKQDLESLPFVKSVSDPKQSDKNNDYYSYSVILDQNPYTPKAMKKIPEIKSTVSDSLKQANIKQSSEHFWIGGETSNLYDTQQVTNRDAKVIVPVVIAVIAILLLLYLRSVIAMVYLILTVLLSYFSALGTGWLVLHQGMGVTAIQGLIPLYSFVFLVALGEDYNIFMISSIWKNRESFSLKRSISKGVSETSSVITSAGLILAGTFAVLATLPIQVLLQFGIVTAIGVLLDTFIVRPLLVPAITTVLGRFAYWPGKRYKLKGK